MFKVLHKERLFAAITAGVVVSAGVIALGGSPTVPDSSTASRASFRISRVMFEASGFNTSSCSLLNGVILLGIDGLMGDQKLTSVTLGEQRIALENTYTHAGETTNVLLDYPWLQGYNYHVTVTSESQKTAEADSPISPIITPINVTIESLSFKGPTIKLSVANHSKCNTSLTEVLVYGPNTENGTNILYTQEAVEPQGSSSLFLLVPFTPQLNAAYKLIVIVSGTALTAKVVAYPTHLGGFPLVKLT